MMSSKGFPYPDSSPVVFRSHRRHSACPPEDDWDELAPYPYPANKKHENAHASFDYAPRDFVPIVLETGLHGLSRRRMSLGSAICNEKSFHIFLPCVKKYTLVPSPRT